MVDLDFRVMGCRARVLVDGPAADAIAQHGVERLHQLEYRWTRFHDSSEIEAANRNCGQWTRVSNDTLLLVDRALFAASWTQGRFDPLLLDELRRLGYDRSHEQLRPARLDPPPARSTLASPLRQPRWHEIAIDRTNRSVRIPAGTAFDPGGIGKGLAADIVATEMMAEGATTAMVDLAGDIRLCGPAIGRTCWEVIIEDPYDSTSELDRVRVGIGAVATSSRVLRRWDHDGETMHHLLDPSSGLPATSDLVAASVVTGEAWWADVLAKVAVLVGSVEAASLLAVSNASGLLVAEDGEVSEVGTREAVRA